MVNFLAGVVLLCLAPMATAEPNSRFQTIEFEIERCTMDEVPIAESIYVYPDNDGFTAEFTYGGRDRITKHIIVLDQETGEKVFDDQVVTFEQMSQLFRNQNTNTGTLRSHAFYQAMAKYYTRQYHRCLTE